MLGRWREGFSEEEEEEVRVCIFFSKGIRGREKISVSRVWVAEEEMG